MLSLSFPDGDAAAALSHHEIVPPGEVGDKPVRVRRSGGGLNFLIGRVGPAVGDVRIFEIY